MIEDSRIEVLKELIADGSLSQANPHEIKRYAPIARPGTKGFEMLAVTHGEYVLHRDHLARIAQLEAQAQKLRKAAKVLLKSLDGGMGLFPAIADMKDALDQKKAGEA